MRVSLHERIHGLRRPLMFTQVNLPPLKSRVRSSGTAGSPTSTAAIPGAVGVLAGVGFSVGAAEASWRLVERRFLSGRRGEVIKRAASGVTSPRRVTSAAAVRLPTR
jgi:peptidoglycan/LPS O-acetylase OafA/YrhL